MTRRLMLISALVLASGGCKNLLSPTKNVSYVVTGPGRADVTYSGFDEVTEQRSGVVLPWSTFVSNVGPGDFLYISAQKDGSSGCITVEIQLDAKYFKSATSCGAFVIATADGSF